MQKSKVKNTKQNINFFERVYDIVRTIPESYVVTYGQIAKVLGTRDARKVGWPRTELSSSRGLRPRSRNAFVRGKAFGLARYVGFALHANRDPNVPCHRVVNKNGRIAENFGGPSASLRTKDLGSFGWKEQKMRLMSEGVEFKDERHVDLKKHLWERLAK